MIRRKRRGDEESQGGGSAFEIDMELVSSASRTSKCSKRSKRTKGKRPESIGQHSDAISEGSELAHHEYDESDNDVSNSIGSTASTGPSWNSSTMFSGIMRTKMFWVPLLIGVIGLMSATIFLGTGVARDVREQETLFLSHADDVHLKFSLTWERYLSAGLWIHQSCALGTISQHRFRHVYEYLSTYLEFQSVECIPKVPAASRSSLEEGSATYYAERLPNFTYNGISGYEPDPNSPSGTSIQNRSEHPAYFPIHFVEPVETNMELIDFDLYSSEEYQKSINDAHLTMKPMVSQPFDAQQQHEAITVPVATLKPARSNNLLRIDFDLESHLEKEIDVEDLSPMKAVRLLHPGLPVTGFEEYYEAVTTSGLVIEIEAYVKEAVRYVNQDCVIYLYDSTIQDSEPIFLIGTELRTEEEVRRLTFMPEISLSELEDTTVVFMTSTGLPLADNTHWTLVVVAFQETYDAHVKPTILTGMLILMICLVMSMWIYTSMRKVRLLTEVRQQREAEKAALIIKSARDAAKMEQDLNDYIAHEVRNPVAAAMSACSFVKSAVNQANPLADKESIDSVREDVEIIDSSLAFANSLLRSMLDMHRVAAKKVMVDFQPVDLHKDILEPVASMLYVRDINVKVEVDCPKNLLIMTDRLRLTQVALNLGRNAIKFVKEGFIRVGAEIVGENVRIYVEDSGYGIPSRKRKNLFAKFQESLDILQQGTGMGLCLCKNIVDLMEGDIWLDETYVSGIEGCPGTRFVIDLRVPPLSEHQYELYIHKADAENRQSSRKLIIVEETPDDVWRESSSYLSAAGSSTELMRKMGSIKNENINGDKNQQNGKMLERLDEKSGEDIPRRQVMFSKNTSKNQEHQSQELPEVLSVLFVDDDTLLRKLFSRSLRRIAKDWNIDEAANGEASLQLVDSNNYDIIFMDQYMASVEKQLLGTETVRALRSKGVTCLICGLSANEMEEEFVKAGANFFLLKPFPCKQDELKRFMIKMINTMKSDPRCNNKPAEATPDSITPIVDTQPTTNMPDSGQGTPDLSAAGQGTPDTTPPPAEKQPTANFPDSGQGIPETTPAAVETQPTANFSDSGQGMADTTPTASDTQLEVLSRGSDDEYSA